jgi:hypothetical protein
MLAFRRKVPTGSSTAQEPNHPMKWNTYRAALLLAAAVRVALAGPTHIHDLLPANSDGTQATGSVVLTWPAFTGTDNIRVVAGQRAVAINNGILDITLAANPVGVNYTATYYLGARTLAQNWHVPDSTTTLMLANVIVVRLPPVGTPGYKVDPSGISPGGGLPGQVLSLNTLLQWAPVTPAATSGPAGPIGPQGRIGLTGPVGPAGAAGRNGVTGPQGLEGNPGSAGFPGTPGAPGGQGPAGPPGAAGAAGATGPAGPAGSAGANGAAGPTGPAGGAGATGPAGPNNNLAGRTLSATAPTDNQVIAYNAANLQYQPTTFVQEESRPMQVSALKPATPATINMAPGATTQLINLSGSGNVSMIQLAIVASGGSAVDQNDATINSIIRICTNGEAAPCQQADIGTFFLLHGIPAPPFTYSDNFAVTQYLPGQIGAFRRIMIPFSNGITISIINSSQVASGSIYSQVYYYAGAPGPQISGTRKKTFHMATIPFTALGQFAPMDLINVTGRGQIEGVHLFVYKSGVSIPTWLEGDMAWTTDTSTTGDVLGTEDFFGGQYYWGQLQYSTDNWGVIKNGTFAGSLFATGMYRLFHKDPVTFNSSFKLTWHNGHVNQGTPPGTVNVSSIVFYYLDQ